MTNPEEIKGGDDFDDIFSSAITDNPSAQTAAHIQRQLAANKATIADWGTIDEQRDLFLEQFAIDNPAYDHQQYLSNELEDHEGAIDFFLEIIEKSIAVKQSLLKWRMFDVDEDFLKAHERSDKMLMTSLFSIVFGYDHSFWPRRMLDVILPEGSMVGEMDEPDFELYTMAETGRTPQETYTFYVAKKSVLNHGAYHIKEEVHAASPNIINQVELVYNVLSGGFELAVDEWDDLHGAYYTPQASSFRQFIHNNKVNMNIKQLFALAYGSDIEYETLLESLAPTIQRIKNVCFRILEIKLSPEPVEETEFDAEAEILLRDFPD